MCVCARMSAKAVRSPLDLGARSAAAAIAFQCLSLAGAIFSRAQKAETKRERERNKFRSHLSPANNLWASAHPKWMVVERERKREKRSKVSKLKECASVNRVVAFSLLLTIWAHEWMLKSVLCCVSEAQVLMESTHTTNSTCLRLILSVWVHLHWSPKVSDDNDKQHTAHTVEVQSARWV